MILPIVVLGNPVLKKQAEDITTGYPDIQLLLDNMFETMDNAKGVGLAAPQIGKSIRVFIVDAGGMDEDKYKNFREVFINPEITEESGETWKFEEGCLSIPGIREMVERPEIIKITYLDRNFISHTTVFDGIAARIIQHEYDHIEGVLFTDLIPNFKKVLIKSRLNNIIKGEYKADYPTKRILIKKAK
ncbi:MAG: peptide deformylase [Bacteroidota bacterium]|nr:peptide deformylase [Bacteroidota bacterium]